MDSKDSKDGEAAYAKVLKLEEREHVKNAFRYDQISKAKGKHSQD